MSTTFFTKNKLIAVIHLPPLPGSPLALKRNLSPWEIIDEVGMLAIRETQILTKAGFQSIILENYGDAPFYKSNVPPETIAALTMICAAVKANTKASIGLNVLRNDPFAALSIASSTGLDFIRVNILNGVTATDQGLIEGKAAELLRFREILRSKVLILADVHVKHAHSLLENSLESSLQDTYNRGGADALIISGNATGEEVSEESIQSALVFAKKYKAPVFIGSGTNEKTIQAYKKQGFGIIIGSFLRKGQKAGEPLDPKNIQKIITLYKKSKK